MKNIFLIVCFLVSICVCNAQNYNLGFEDWNSSMPAGVNYTDTCHSPLRKSSIDSVYMLSEWTGIPFGLCRTTDARSGNYAVVVYMWYNGSMGRLSLGQCEETFNSGYDVCKKHFSTKIYGISGYYKYIVDSFMPNDTYNKRVTAHIKTYKWNTASNSLLTVSHDSLIYPRSDIYKPFQLPIHYPDSFLVSADSVSIWFESQGYHSGITSCVTSHFLYLDDLEFHFLPMSVGNIPLKKKLKLYPNPASKNINVDYESDVRVQSIQLTDALGRVVKAFKKTEKLLDISDVPIGMYFLNIQAIQGSLVEKVMIE